MFTSLALMAALSTAPAQAGLKITNDRVTFGELGSPRPDTKFLPGDLFFVSFDVEGIAVDPTGKVQYTMEMVLVDKSNKEIFKQTPFDRDEFAPLGGNRIPARAYLIIGDQPPGEYTCKIKFTDRVTKASQTLEKKFEVVPKKFGIVGLYTSYDESAALPAPQVGLTGQVIWLHFGLAHFQRNAATKQPDIEVDMVITENGKPTLAKPASKINIAKDIDEKLTGVPMRLLLPMTRPGKYVVTLNATDKLSKATTTISLPVEVMPAVGK